MIYKEAGKYVELPKQPGIFCHLFRKTTLEGI